MQPQQVLQERGTPVYSCTCSCGPKEVQAVMKVGECEHEVRVCVPDAAIMRSLLSSPSRF